MPEIKNQCSKQVKDGICHERVAFGSFISLGAFAANMHERVLVGWLMSNHA